MIQPYTAPDKGTYRGLKCGIRSLVVLASGEGRRRADGLELKASGKHGSRQLCPVSDYCRA